MPGFNRKGPVGAGPMTGGRGYGKGMGCRRGAGMRFGPGRGLAGGFYGMWPAYPAGDAMGKADEKAMLKAERRAMQTSLEVIEKRIEELDQAESAQ